MKKRILSLLCGLVMTATMFTSLVSVNAEVSTTATDPVELKVVSDLDSTTGIKAGDEFNISVVLDGAENLASWNSKKKTGTGISAIQLSLFVPDNAYITSDSESGVYSGAMSNWIETDGGYYFAFAWAGVAGNMISTKPVTLYSISMKALADIDSEVKIFIADHAANINAKIVKEGFESGSQTLREEYNAVTTKNLKLTPLVLGVAATEKTEWTSTDDANIPAGQKIVAHSQNVTGVTADTRVAVTIGNETKTFGNNIGNYFTSKGIQLEGTADLDVRFAVLVDSTVDASDVSFNIQ